MYAIDFNTCTALDVIEQSIVCHPTMFAETMLAMAATHARYATATTDARVASIAAEMATQCREIAEMVADTSSAHETARDIAGPVGTCVLAFNVAAKLTLVPRHLWDAILSR